MEEYYTLKNKARVLRHSFVFNYFYLFIAALLYLVAAPFLLLFALRDKYKDSIPARFFLKGNKPFKSDGVHFHVCSYGEARALKPLVSKLPKEQLYISAITQTGFSVIREYTSSVRYLPYELFLPFWIKRQKALVVLEAELWYMLFFMAKRKGAKTFLVNARVSSRSYPRYLKFKWFYKRVFKHIDAVYAQSFDDAKRLARLGARNIKVNGNIKFLNIAQATKEYTKAYPLVVTAASTHEGEEEGILEAFLALKEVEAAQLIVVPRHPERFKKVEEMLQRAANKHGLSFSSFSQNQHLDTDIEL